MKTKRIIDVRDPKRISFEKSLRFCLKGIRHRMLRSSLTQAVVVMAVAFFMVLLTESVIQWSVARGVSGESASMREPSVLLAHLQNKPSATALSRHLARSAGNPAKLNEAAGITGLPIQKVTELAARCRIEQTYLDFFAGMGSGKRRILIKKHTGRQIFTHLAPSTAWQSFLTKLEPMRTLKLPTSENDLRSFLDGFDAFVGEMTHLAGLWGKKVTALREVTTAFTAKAPLDQWLTTADPAALTAWRNKVTEHGFALEADQLARVRDHLALSLTRDRIEKALRSPELVAQWRKTFYSSATLEDKMTRLGDPKVGTLLGNAYPPELLTRVVKRVRYERKLQGLERWMATSQESKSGSVIGGRKIFLALIAFLVCIVGITNAMLMSVTERFMEIATMKCLGATDGFILKQFVLEAGFQGFLGGTLGMLIGLLIAVLKGLIQLGDPVLTYFPMQYVAACSLTAVVSGVVLAMLAAIYPSWSASRMAPMEAMRVE
ncbi:MAG: ABC transporter permease [Planctomycetota bacterium]|jgi:hypothetical protein